MRKIKQNMRLYAGKLRSLSGIDIPTSIPDHAYCSTADIRTETEIVRNHHDAPAIPRPFRAGR